MISSGKLGQALFERDHLSKFSRLPSAFESADLRIIQESIKR